jgi:hypothetical protein
MPPLDAPMLGDVMEAPVALFTRPDSACFQGKPLSPRHSFDAVLLGDAKTIVAYGGLSEVAGDVLKYNVIAGLPRVTQRVSNSTALIMQIAPIDAAAAGFSRFACSAEQSEQVRSTRLLPDDA